MSTAQLFPLADNQDAQYPLDFPLKQYLDGSWRIPAFQRDFVWLPAQVADWGKSIVARGAVGVMMIYQPQSEVRGGFAPVYVADGRQRLEATRLFVEAPARYGFDFDSSDAQLYAEAMFITIQRRIVADHDEAYLQFRRLNSGTYVQPIDYFRGELVTIPRGLEVYQDTVQTMTSAAERVCKPIPPGFLATFKRDALLQYYQLVSGTTKLQFGNATSKIVHSRSVPAERRVAGLLAEMTGAEVEKATAEFQAVIEGTAQDIRDGLTAYRGPDASISAGLFCVLCHAATFGRNTGRDNGWFHETLGTVLSISPNLNTRLIIDMGGDTYMQVQLKADTLGHLARALRAMGRSL